MNTNNVLAEHFVDYATHPQEIFMIPAFLDHNGLEPHRAVNVTAMSPPSKPIPRPIQAEFKDMDEAQRVAEAKKLRQLMRQDSRALVIGLERRDEPYRQSSGSNPYQGATLARVGYCLLQGTSSSKYLHYVCGLHTRGVSPTVLCRPLV